jgi:hypothetical protein
MSNSRHIAVIVTLAAVLVAAGCRHDRHPSVPARAMMLSEGDGRLAASAEGPGTFYVVDERSNEIRYSGKVERGQSITVDPRENEIRVDDRVVSENRLNSGNRHRIFFDRGEVVRERITIEERRSR